VSNLRNGGPTFAERVIQALDGRNNRATVRRLSWDLGARINTVVRAVNRLETEGAVLVDRPGVRSAKSTHYWHITKVTT
jgi:DNA-binding transcriptional MocR family regulator